MRVKACRLERALTLCFWVCLMITRMNVAVVEILGPGDDPANAYLLVTLWNSLQRLGTQPSSRARSGEVLRITLPGNGSDEPAAGRHPQ
jgi:hypothetical protein